MAARNAPVPGTTLVFAALAASCIASIVLLVLPVYASSTTTASVPGGPPTGTRGSATLLTANGLSALRVLLAPVVVSALPLFARDWRPALFLRLAATLVLLGVVLLGAMTVGFFYLPGAVLMGFSVALLAAAKEPRLV